MKILRLMALASVMVLGGPGCADDAHPGSPDTDGTDQPGIDDPHDVDTPAAAERFVQGPDIAFVTDVATGLNWLASSPAVPLDWSDASDFCASLDMRLPTIGELAVLFEPTPAGDCALSSAFSGACDAHWTSDKTKNVSVYAYILDPTLRELSDRHQNQTATTRCVADARIGPAPVDGASVLVAGKRWMRHSPAVSVFHQAAIDSCDALCFDGSCDWRLPTRDELVTLTLLAGDACAMPDALTGPCSSYWSSTMNTHLAAYQVDFEAGAVEPNVLDAWAHFRCIEGLTP